jgi:hypothetical protein
LSAAIPPAIPFPSSRPSIRASPNAAAGDERYYRNFSVVCVRIILELCGVRCFPEACRRVFGEAELISVSISLEIRSS